jgi:hypothetical protein
VPLERRRVHDCADRDEDCAARHRDFASARIYPWVFPVFPTTATLVMTVLKPTRVEHDSAKTDCTRTKSDQAGSCDPPMRR